MIIVPVTRVCFLLGGLPLVFLFFFFFNDPATTEIYTLSLHDALPISPSTRRTCAGAGWLTRYGSARSEEHTSELQSRRDLVCRLLLEKKKQDRKDPSLNSRQVQISYAVFCLKKQ